MALRESLKRNRSEIEGALAGTAGYRHLSPVVDAQYRAVLPLLARYAHGALIDLGCGHQPYRRYLPARVQEYHSLDVAEDLVITFRQDVQDMPAVPSDYYDTALCFEVLEHIPDPDRALEEIARILAPGGALILSVPHLSRLHNEPSDYYRFTQYGLAHLVERAGLRVQETMAKGGLGTFLGHQLSILVLSAVWRKPGIWQAVWLINRFLLIPVWRAIDAVLPSWFTAPAGYVAVAVKPSAHIAHQGDESVPDGSQQGDGSNVSPHLR